MPPTRGARLSFYQERYRANPKDADAALQYGKALRAPGQRSQAVAVLEQATIAHPSNKALLAGYGRALADNGNFQQAFDVLGRAHSPDDPDWRILSAQGAALDQLGRYEEARQYYASALKIAPDRAVGAVQSRPVLRAFEGSAEGRGDAAARSWPARTRSARAGQPGAGGRPAGPLGRGRKIVKADLPPEEAAANVAQLKRMLSRKDKENARAEAGKCRSRPPAALTR